MSKILVTGSAGFIGSRVCDKLTALGHEVIPYDVVTGQDLFDLDQLEAAVKEADVVYHIAAEADLTKMAKSVDAGRDGVRRNVEATHNVAYVCSKYNKWLIYTSTVCVYGNLPDEAHPANEDKVLPNPSELYACSKYAGEWIVKGYSLNYGNPYTIHRYATIFGPGMRDALAVSIFIRQALSGEPITVHGDGLQDRTQTFVDDLVEGIVAPLEHPFESYNQTFNLTNPRSVSALEMAEDIKRLTNSSSEIVFIPQRQNQTFHEDFDVSKAKELLSWEARTPWDESLIKTIEWINEVR